VDDGSTSVQDVFSITQYRQLAELRFQLRHFLQFSEQAARANGLEPQQHQLMLAIKGLLPATSPTVSALANRLCLKHHSTVELINRLVDRGAAVRRPCPQDRRQVLVELTPLGEELLETLAALHSEELDQLAPKLLHALAKVIHNQTAENGCSSEKITKSYEAAQ
jgi:DNA-binding MarR family transcriptional regulator